MRLGHRRRLFLLRASARVPAPVPAPAPAQPPAALAYTRVSEIVAAEWAVEVGVLGRVVEGPDDVDQALRVILDTPRGSVPHRPDFGCELWRALDLPLPRARAWIAREVLDAVAASEPRARVERVEVEPSARHGAAALLVRLTYTLRPGVALADAPAAIGAATRPRVLELLLADAVGAPATRIGA